MPTCRLMKLTPSSVLNLGPGWANTTVNTVIFRHHGIVTRWPYQFASYFDVKGGMVVVRRDLRDDSCESHVLPGKYNTRDAHNAISLGIDPEGYLHIAYDHHGVPLRYRRSTTALAIDVWTEPLRMTGQFENRVTYPYFIMAPRNSEDAEYAGDLYFMYRHGSSGKGDICLKAYDHTTQTWSDRALCFVKGTEQSPWTSNAYWNHPSFDSKGRMHLSWVWRVNRGGPPGGLINNINMGYACTPDMGRTWLTSRGLPIPLPLTQVNSEVIWPIPPGSNLINQCSSAMDSNDRLHIVAYADDPHGIPQYFHLWFDGRSWRFDFITNRTEDFALIGGGSLQIPFSRPEIIVDRQDRVYVIYRGDLTENRLIAQRLDPPDYSPPGEAIALWDQDLGHAEPVIDRVRWKRDGVLSMLVQKNYQPDHDAPTDVPAEPVYIVDWRIPAE
ncbi:MAG: BNR repeat-containing protein [bacterium]